MNKKKAVIQLLVCILILGFFVYLAYGEEIRMLLGDNGNKPKNPTATPTAPLVWEENNKEQKAVIIWSADDFVGLKAGELRFELSNLRLVSHAGEIPNPEGFTDDAAIAYPGQSENIYECPTFRYPDFIQEDGSFIPGAYLLLVDVTVTSKEAKHYTINDLDSEGYPMGQYEDETAFRADLPISLINTAGYIPGKSMVYGISYYSGKGTHPEHPMLFQVDSGETITFTLGFLIDDKEYGGRFDLTQLTICDIMGAPDAVYIPLKLGGN